MIEDPGKKKKIMAVASAGGHWIELLRIRPALKNFDVVFVSTDPGNEIEVQGYEFYHIVNATRKNFWNFFRMVFQLFRIMKMIHPRVIITTGSAPGLMSLAVGKIFGTKNVWIDSIANVDELSMSGSKARHFADLYLTQWPDLAHPNGPQFKGSVL